MTDVPIYKEKENLVFEKVFLPDDVYAESLKSFVLVCADTLIVNKTRKTVYLAKRKSKPQSDWWMIGGRVLAGEEERVAMRRLFKRETSLVISEGDFEFIRMQRFQFKDREQDPQETPCDSLCYTFYLNIEDEEVIKTISDSLDKEEYETDLGLVPFDREKMEREKVHQVLIDLYDLTFK